MLERLTAMGFRKVGEWQIEDDKLRYTLEQEESFRNVLYAFISDTDILYIGKTVQPLKKRMYGYQNPGPTQATNLKGNRLIRETLDSTHMVDIYVLPDHGLLHYGGFHINLAAGLEDSLISTLQPPWNKMGI